MIIYGSSLSPYVRKVLVVAAEKGVQVDLQRTGPAPGQHSDEFREASPLGKMPAMRDGDFALCDSSAIIHYIEAKFPDRPMIPAEPRMKGRTIWFEEYADTVMMAAGGKIFFNRVVAPRFFGRPGDEEVAAKAEREELPLVLEYLEKTVPSDGGYLVGDGLTLADIAIASPFATLAHAGTVIDKAKYPRTAAYIARIVERPSFTQYIERERALLEKVAA